ncbi:unnamed protein product [Clavelina lepadiformis]|uniref:Uncharacterized protein n=1 Tax=Clavelina lepadiformis TaxID=159417 RepID=A0ABP0FRA1_CLALP
MAWKYRDFNYRVTAAMMDEKLFLSGYLLLGQAHATPSEIQYRDFNYRVTAAMTGEGRAFLSGCLLLDQVCATPSVPFGPKLKRPRTSSTS